MAFELKMTEQEAVDGLKETYGTEFTTADVKAFCAMNDIGYQTVTKKIQKYKVSKGKWNLEIPHRQLRILRNHLMHLLLFLLRNRI